MKGGAWLLLQLTPSPLRGCASSLVSDSEVGSLKPSHFLRSLQRHAFKVFTVSQVQLYLPSLRLPMKVEAWS